MKKINILLSLFFTGAVTASEGIDGVVVSLEADDLVVVQAGEVVYRAQCASCHGVDLEGQANWRSRDANGYLPAPPHDVDGHTWHHGDDMLFEITKYGPGLVVNQPDYKSTMPSFEGILSDADIIAVLSYIKNSWPEEQRSWQEDINDAKKDRFQVIEKDKPSFLEKLFK